MPKLIIRFTGMCVFVRHPKDEKVEVRFITGPEPAGSGNGDAGHAAHGHAHAHDGAEPRHVPKLVVSPESWLKTSLDDKYEGRAAGRTVYLARRKSLEILTDGPEAAGKVTVVEGTLKGNKPSKADDWTDFDLIPKLEEMFSGGKYDSTMADQVAKHAPLTLRGGTLCAAPPIDAAAEERWLVTMPGATCDSEVSLTDVVVYTLDFKQNAKLLLPGTEGANDLTIYLRDDRDAQIWISNEPPVSSFLKSSPELQHFATFGSVLAKPRPAPPKIRLPQLQNPDETSCPPTQARVS